MPEYFEVRGTTVKLARAQLKRNFSELSIVKEELVKERNWKWLGLKRRSYYRIVVCQYHFNKLGLGGSNFPQDVTSNALKAHVPPPVGMTKVAKPTRTPNKPKPLARTPRRLAQEEPNGMIPRYDPPPQATTAALAAREDYASPQDHAAQANSTTMTKTKAKDFKEEYSMRESLRNFMHALSKLQRAEAKKDAAHQASATLFAYAQRQKATAAEKSTAQWEWGRKVGEKKPKLPPPNSFSAKYEAGAAGVTENSITANAIIGQATRLPSTVAAAKETKVFLAKKQPAPLAMHRRELKQAKRQVASMSLARAAKGKTPLRGAVLEQKPASNLARVGEKMATPAEQLRSAHVTSSTPLVVPTVQDFLKKRDFSARIIAEVSHFSGLTSLRTAEDKKILAEMLATLLTYEDGMGATRRKPHEGPKLIFMAGSTGVGKTTTLSKLAFAQLQAKKLNVTLASYDLRRMAAFEQLKSFADIVKVPLHKICTKKDLLKLYQDCFNHDLIFIDTPGCSTQEHGLIAEVAALINFLGGEKDVFWCVPATIRHHDLFRMKKSFTAHQPTQLIFTKVDESSSLGAVVSLAYESKLPVAYLCTGQDVLKDFTGASMEKIEAALLREWGLTEHKHDKS